MKDKYFEIKEGQYGLWDDGRHYKVISIPSITMCSNGTLHHGDIELLLDDEYYKLRISEFVTYIKTIGDLTIEQDLYQEQATRD